MPEEPLFFVTPEDFRNWLAAHHADKVEQWVGFYKKGSNLPSITWPESVDQALCFGWIDGLRKSIDQISYKIRFTPRKPSSHWSAVNLARVKELSKSGLMQPAGLAAYALRDAKRSRQASYEQRGNITLDPKFEKQLKNEKPAWKDFSKRPPSYQKQCIWWIMSAKRDETRKKRLEILINSSTRGEKVPPLRWQK